MKHLVLSLLIFAGLAMAGEYDPLIVLTKNCAGCHQTEKHPGVLFLNRARLTEPQTIDLMIKLIEKGKMPREHKEFAKSEDGKMLLKWLKEQRSKKN